MKYIFQVIIDDSCLDVHSIGRIHSEIHRELKNNIFLLQDYDKSLKISRETVFQPDYCTTLSIEEVK